jgi:hypothetical protein
MMSERIADEFTIGELKFSSGSVALHGGCVTHLPKTKIAAPVFQGNKFL